MTLSIQSDRNHFPSETYSGKTIAELEDYAILVRKMMLDMYDDFGCLSGAFSSVELYVALYLSHLDLNLVSANDPARTRVLAKGTASMAFYATLSAAGIIDPERLKHYGTFSLPTLYRVDMTAVDATHYTLGPSLGTAVGIALASKLKGTPFDVICFMGDGELQEGVDQAAKSAVSFGLNNLTVVVDCNALQSYYPTTTGDPSMQEDADGRLTRQVEFWRACGWQVTEIDGHDLSMIMQAYSRMGKTNEPYIILARTIKGKGVQEIEGKMGYEHHMSTDELTRARQTYAKKSQAVRLPVKKIPTREKENRLSPLAVPQLEGPHRDMRKAFGEWIRMLKNGNIGRVYSIDSDCRNIFSSECTAEIVSPANYQSKHIFPGLNERLTLTIAKGLGYEGLFSVVGSRTNNLTDTSEEWHAICFDQLPVLLVGTRPGAIQADWFPLKCSFNDIEIMGRHGCSIYQPSNSEDLNWLLEHIYQDPKQNLPAYLRLPDFENRGDVVAPDCDNSWENGYYVVRGGSYEADYVAVIASGDSLKEILTIHHDSGATQKIKVINLFNLSQINPAALQKDLAGARSIFSVIEGRSSSISEMIFLAISKKQRMIYEPLGINSSPYIMDKSVFQEHGFYGARDYVLQTAGLDIESLARRFQLA